MDQVLLMRVVFAVLLAVAGVWLLYVGYLARTGELERRRLYGRVARAEMFSDDAWYEAQVIGAPWVSGSGYAAFFGAVGVAVAAETQLAVQALTVGAVIVAVVCALVGVTSATRAARDVVRGRR